MRPPLARLILAATLATLALAAPAQAGIWTPLASNSTAEITGVEYHSDSRFWFVTANGEVFTRQPNGTFLRTFGPSFVRLTDITFRRTDSAIGFAVGDGGQVLRSTDSGATWTDVNPSGNRIPASKKATTFPDCRATETLGNVNSVRFAGPGRVWIMGEGAQLATSQPGNDTVGFTGNWSDANRVTNGPGVDDDTCRLATAYNTGIGDVFFAGTNPNLAWFCTAYFGEVFRTQDNLATNGQKLTGNCGNGDVGPRRVAGDPENPGRQWAVGPGGTGRSFTQRTADGWTSSQPFPVANDDAHVFDIPFDVAYNGGSVVAVGENGTIVNSVDGVTFYNNLADGTLANVDWRAVSLASGTNAAIGGVGGVLATTTQANTIPDIVAPSGSITPPAVVTAGQPASFTANLADNAGGSGINPAATTWEATGLPAVAGNPASFTFPAPGFYSVRVRFADLAGNPAEATTSVSVRAAAGTFTGPTTNVSTSTGNSKLTLNAPKTCLEPGQSYRVKLSVKRKKKKGPKVVKVSQVVFSIDGATVKTDKKAPFVQTLTVRTSQARGSTIKLRARATIKVKRGRKAPKKSLNVTLKVCA